VYLLIKIIQEADYLILNYIQNNLHFLLLNKIMTYISFIGNAGAIWIIITILFLISKKTRHTGLIMAISLILCLLIGNITLKPLVARIRPFDINPEITLLIPKPTDYSFPSGHTMSSFAASTAIFSYNKFYGKLAIVLALLISFSRLYLYVHFPSDVFIGMIIGISNTIISLKFSKYLNKNDRDNQ